MLSAYEKSHNAAIVGTLARRVECLERAFADYRAAVARYRRQPGAFTRGRVSYWAQSVREWRRLVQKTRAEIIR